MGDKPDNNQIFLRCHSVCLQNISVFAITVFSNAFLSTSVCFSGRQTHSLLPSNITTVCPFKKCSEVAFVLGSLTFSVRPSIVSPFHFHRYFSYTREYLLAMTFRLTRFHTIHKRPSLPPQRRDSSFQSHNAPENIEKTVAGFYCP